MGKTNIFLSLSPAQRAAGAHTASQVLVCTGTEEKALGREAETEMGTLGSQQE